MFQKSDLAVSQPRKRKVEEAVRGKTGRPKKRVRKQAEYHSSSDESEPISDRGFAPVNLLDSDEEELISRVPSSEKVLRRPDGESDVSGKSDAHQSDDSQFVEGNGVDISRDFSSANRTQRKASTKRNDPEAFSTSITKILSTKLSQNARKDPVLSRSREAVQASNDIANERLEKRAKAKLRADRKEDLERGRVKDVLGLTTGDAGQTAEEEKRLRRIAQKGVVKLFNAVRAAQVKGREAAEEARKKSTVGFANREQKTNEAVTQGFLDFITGNKKGKPIEEA
jgi:Rrp15p